MGRSVNTTKGKKKAVQDKPSSPESDHAEPEYEVEKVVDRRLVVHFPFGRFSRGLGSNLGCSLLIFLEK